MPTEALAMGTMILKCPVTGSEYAIALEMDEASYARSPDLKVKSRCPYCGAEHVFALRDTRLNHERLAGIPSVADQNNPAEG